MAEPVDGGGVNPVDSQINALANGRDGVAIVLRSPCEFPSAAADGPCSQTNRSYFHITVPKFAFFHDCSFFTFARAPQDEIRASAWQKSLNGREQRRNARRLMDHQVNEAQLVLGHPRRTGIKNDFQFRAGGLQPRRELGTIDRRHVVVKDRQVEVTAGERLSCLDRAGRSSYFVTIHFKDLPQDFQKYLCVVDTQYVLAVL